MHSYIHSFIHTYIHTYILPFYRSLRLRMAYDWSKRGTFLITIESCLRLYVCMYSMFVYVCMYVCMYVCYRHRQLLVDMPPVFALVPRVEEPNPSSGTPSSQVDMHTYIHTVHTCIHTLYIHAFIHTYIHTVLLRVRHNVHKYI